MNLTELKYITAIARYGSVNAAAREIYVAQPNLSKAIRNLEEEFGIRLFDRSSAGMEPTEEGRRFIRQAETILKEVERLNSDFFRDWKRSAELKISIPRASYISYAAAAYLRGLKDVEQVRIEIRECSAMDAINNLLHHDHHLAVVRYDAEEENAYASLFRLKNLDYRLLLEEDYRLVTKQGGRLAGQEPGKPSELDDYLEIVYRDERLPDGSSLDTMWEQEALSHRRTVQVHDRGSQFDILRELPDSYMWVSPVPPELLSQYGLTEKRCAWQKKRFRDVIVCPAGRIPGKEERDFIAELEKEAKRIEDGE